MNKIESIHILTVYDITNNRPKLHLVGSNKMLPRMLREVTINWFTQQFSVRSFYRTDGSSLQEFKQRLFELRKSVYCCNPSAPYLLIDTETALLKSVVSAFVVYAETDGSFADVSDSIDSCYLEFTIGMDDVFQAILVWKQTGTWSPTKKSLLLGKEFQCDNVIL